MNKIKYIVALISILFVQVSFADIGSDLDNFFSQNGVLANVTAPGVYNDQEAGYYSGGSISLRAPVRDFQIASLQLPSFSGGCGGIDMFMGSFSLMSSAQLTQMMKSIMSSGVGYAMDVALEAAVPQLKAVKDRLESMMHKINSMNMNSCEIGQDLVGGLFPKMQGSSQRICKDISTQQGNPAKDWAQAQQDCGATGNKEAGTIQGADKKHKPEIDDGNIVWQALQNDGIATQDPELAEFMMTLTGTVVVSSTTDPVTFLPIAGEADSSQLLDALLHGSSKMYILVCDENTKCLSPLRKPLSLAASQSLESKVNNDIVQLAAALKADTGTVSPEIQSMIETVPVPILAWIDGQLEQGRQVNPDTYSDIIATSLLQQYLMENIQYVRAALNKSSDSQTKAKMIKQIQQVEMALHNELDESYKSTISQASVIHDMQYDNQKIAANVSTLMGSGGS